MLWLAWFVLKETVHPDKVLTGGGQLPLGGMEITSKSFKERRIQTHFEKKDWSLYGVFKNSESILSRKKGSRRESLTELFRNATKFYTYTVLPLKPPIVVPKM